LKALFLFFVLLPALAFGYPLVPDKKVTPGSVCSESNPDFDEHRYSERIAHCDRNVEHETKAKIYDWYRIPEKERTNYTIDHLIPLSIGGDNSEKNLWPEHRQLKAKRPHLEEEIHRQLRDGELSQRAAIDRILKAKFVAIAAEEESHDDDDED
jgi:hypothetical protein